MIRNSSFRLLIASLTLALAACGGGGAVSRSPPPPPPPPANSGLFVDGAAQGVRFQTASQSGLTDAGGHFLYLPGETVTFSIGGIRLGSAAGAARVSPFDFFGATPPATEAALRAELANTNDITNFDRVANISRLLVSLDSDQNPDNGLDLTGWDSKLAGVSLNLDAPLYAFAEQFELFARIHAMNRNVSIGMPLVQLYHSLGITVAVHAAMAVSEDTDGNGAPDRSEKMDYDAQGRMLAFSEDSNADGRNEYVRHDGFDNAGRRVRSVVDRDDNSDGRLDSRSSETFTYDANGNQLTDVNDEDTDGNGSLDGRTQLTATYDASGNKLTAVQDYDVGGDGTVNTRDVYTYTYDAVGNLVSSLREYDAGADGVVNIRQASNETHDSDGHGLTETTRLDLDANGVVDATRARTSSYDQSGRLLTDLLERDDNGDGTPDSRIRRSHFYDAAGRRLTYTVDEDFDADGVVDYQEVTSYTYDAAGNELTQTIDSVNTSPLRRERSTFTATYDGVGNLLKGVREVDPDADGSIESRQTFTYTYDAAGNALTSRRDEDENADGVPELSDLATFTLGELPDGLGYLFGQ